jgi:hypothetical protein
LFRYRRKKKRNIKKFIQHQHQQQKQMASNGHGNPGSSILILYKIVNSESDGGDEALFNAFSMPRGSSGPTLAAVKQ